MKNAASGILTLIFTASVFSMIIECEESKIEREAKIAQIRVLFDFDMVSKTVRTLVSENKTIESVSLESAKLVEKWTPHMSEFNSGFWWLSYEGSNRCFLTVYFMEETKTIHSNGDTALTFAYELEIEKNEKGEEKVTKLTYKSHATSSGFMWISP